MAAAGSMQIGALGPLHVEVDGSTVALGGSKPRTVLARLVVAHPGSVESETLADAVWGEHRPPTYQNTLQIYISRLRHLLGDNVILRTATGYQLALDVTQADWLRFAEAFDLATRAGEAHRHAEVVSLLEPALAIWRSGQPLGDADGDWAAPFTAKLLRERHWAVCRLAASQLALGAFDAAIAALAAVDPDSYDEVPVELAMRAHHYAGRQTEALAVFEQHRARVAEDTGLDPSPELAQLQIAVLRHAPELVWTPPERPPTPRLLPPRVHGLIGRSGELARISLLLAQDRWVALFGLAGSGKTSLAAELAHTFAGTVCWVPASEESAALAALTELAFRIGLPRGLSREELLEMVWGRLDDLGDWLLVLDDAGSPDDAQWLLPSRWSRGRVLLTTLDPTWKREATAVRVDPLSARDALEMVLRRTGRTGLDIEPPAGPPPEAAVQLVAELGGLPLALEQACTYMNQTGMSPAHYLKLFWSRRDQLLTRGAPAGHPNPATSTWQLLYEKVRRRSAAAAEMLEIAAFLSPHGVPWSLLSDDEDGSPNRQLLRLDAVLELVRCSLVDRDDAELRVHRLVQGVVRGSLAHGERARRADAAVRALLVAVPAQPDQPASWPIWSALLPQLEALLRAAQDVHVVPPGIVALTCQFAAYLRYRSGLLLAESLVNLAVQLLQKEGRPQDLATLYAQRSEVKDDLGRLPEARTDILLALSLGGPRAVEHSDLESARTWSRLAHVLNCADERHAAVDLYERAVEVFDGAGERVDQVAALIGLAYTRWGLDDYVAAAADCRLAVRLLEQTDRRDHPLHPAALSAWGMMLHELGECEQARKLQMTALREYALIHKNQDHHDVAYVHDKLGYVEGLLGHYERSRAEHQRAGEMLARLFGDRDPRRAICLSNRGLAEYALGECIQAQRSQEEAYVLLMTAFGADHKLTRLVSDRLAALTRRPVPLAADPVPSDETPRYERGGGFKPSHASAVSPGVSDGERASGEVSGGDQGGERGNR